MFQRHRFSHRSPSKVGRKCYKCGEVFQTTYEYKGKTPKCWSCQEHEARVTSAQYTLGGFLRQWRKAKSGDVATIVSLLKKPDYARLLQLATQELMREMPDGAMTSFRAYIPASLLSTLCARVDPSLSIPPSMLSLIRPIVAASSPAVLRPPPGDYGHWTHPVNFLLRGDPLFKQCRETLLGDVRWGCDIHSLLPLEAQKTYVLLGKTLWMRNVHVKAVFESICSFLPPVVQNTSSNFSFQTVLEIADNLGTQITQKYWEEATLEMIASIMSTETQTYISPAQLPTLDFRYPDFLS